jgi:phenylalanyl-tRNA synthetase alpha chain
MTEKINQEMWKVFQILLDADRPLPVEEIISCSGIDQAKVMAALFYGRDKGWIELKETTREELNPAEEAAARLSSGIPERQVLEFLSDSAQMPIQDVAKFAKKNNLPMNEIMRWGTQRNWFKKDKGHLAITDQGLKAIDKRDEDEKAVALALEQGPVFLDQLKEHNIDAEKAKSLLKSRTNLAKIKERTLRSACLTSTGKKKVPALKVVKEQNILSSDDITSGEWRNIQLRSYDVTLPAETVHPAKIHPMQKVIQQARTAFLEMGFSEIVSPQAESAFWDFDALFQPQDHPARDMQDTFYLERPDQARLPAPDLVEKIKQTHENGGETGSKGWGYQWQERRARQVVLRTHTTASTIRAVQQDPNPPRKVFCVGKVYRNEAISYKHLPEFLQVDGVIIDEDASLATLLGTLQEFYRKMGFDKVKFKPSFYPYTEPSADVIVWMESKQSWIELGGSGVFRPEVTIPLGCKVPVLAWGLGLDRLAMLRYGFKDIRELYWSDLDKIKEVPLCR